MKKNVSLILFAMAVFTIGSAFYLTRNSLSTSEGPVKRTTEVVEVDTVEVRK